MKIVAVVCSYIFILVISSSSEATLGEPINSTLKNLSTDKTSQKISSTQNFSIHEYEKNGNTIREYASESGVVFAVSWRGISKPDLNALFGSYFTEYKEALDEIPKQFGTKTVSMKTSKMVVRRGGRMRDQRGFAYIPALVPEGVRVEDLQ